MCFEGEYSVRFLVVEDEKTLQDIYLSELNLYFEGSTVHLASNGVEALELLSSNSYDLVLTDGRMPEMGGVELAHTLRKSNFKTPIILVSGYTEDMHENSTRELFTVIKEKPLEFDEFLEEINDLIKERRL